jgi:alpha-galactosidase
MSFNLTESPWIRAGRQYAVRVGLSLWPLYTPEIDIDLCFFSSYSFSQDLWTHTDNGTAVRNFTAYAVPPHGVVALLLKDAGDEPKGTMPFCAREEWCIHKNGTRYGRDGWHSD